MTIKQIDNQRHAKRMHVRAICRAAGISKTWYYRCLRGDGKMAKSTLQALDDVVRAG